MESHVIPKVLNGLQFCHDNRIIHRDIKPSNIFYRDKWKKDIAIGDFDISTLLYTGDAITITERNALTMDYAAPELFGWQGTVYIGYEVDFYALGITLLHLCGGMSPFMGLSLTQIFTKHVSETISLPNSFSERFKELLSGLLKKERKKTLGNCWN